MIEKLKELGLQVKSPKYNNKVEVIITGDENDADYVTSQSFLSLKDFEEVLPIFKKILKRKGCNWEEAEEYLTEDERELMLEYKPYGNGGGDIHTINSIEMYFLSKEDNIRYELSIK